MGRLILVRHGESAGNRDRIYAIDQHALELTELGRAQALEAAHLIGELYRPDLVIASPYIRAHETARIIALHLGVPLEVEARLFEREVGVFRGLPYDSLVTAADYDPLQRFSYRPKDGESYHDVRVRVGPILDRIAQQHRERDVVVVSHGGVMMALWAHVTGDWSQCHTPPNCGMVLIEHDADGYRKPRVIAGPGGSTEAAPDAGG